MPRWITITQEFNYRWPGVQAVTHFRATPAHPIPREELVKDDVADFAIAKGFATEGRADGSTAKSRKSGPPAKTRRRKTGKAKVDAAPADHGPDDGVDGAGVADDDRASLRGAVDPDAVE